jgi:hypothetical protein
MRLIWTVDSCVIGFLPEIIKVEGGLLKEVLLISLDGKVIVSASFLYQIAGRFTLS